MFGHHPSYEQLQQQVEHLRMENEILLMLLRRPPVATTLVLESIIYNDKFVQSMPQSMKPTDYLILTLSPVAVNAQGNKTNSEIKAGSVLTAVANDPTSGQPVSDIVTLGFNPQNALQLKIAGIPGSNGGAVNLMVTGTNDAGNSISFTDQITVASPTPPTATELDGSYAGPFDQTANPAPF